MSTVLLFSLYFLALTLFLGLDLLGRVPPTLYALVLAGLGVLGVGGAVGAWRDPGGGGRLAAAFLAGAAMAAGVVAIGRLVAPYRKRGPSR